MRNGYRKTPNGLTDRDFTFTNPFDLAPVYAAYAQAIEEEFAQLEPGQILVILSGERHNNPLDVLAHIGAIDYLHKRYVEHKRSHDRRFFVAYEMASNLIVTLADICEIDVPDYLKNRPEALDPDNRIALDIMSSRTVSLDAPYSNNIFCNFLKKQSIPTLFNDMARFYQCGKSYLHTGDPLIKTVFLEYLNLNPDLYDIDEMTSFLEDHMEVTHPISMGIRNLRMVKKALLSAQITQTRIIFQHCGQDHVLDAMKNSLAFLYREAGARVLPVFSHMPFENADYFKEFSGALIRRGSDGARFEVGEEGFLSNKQDMSDRYYIETLEKNYSGHDCPFSVDDVPTPITAEEIRHRLRQNIEKNRRVIFHQQMPALTF